MIVIESVLQYLEDSCSRFPNKAALSDQQQSLTFAQLRHRARAFAEKLQPLGQHRPIGVFAERTVTPAIGYLAVLYSGNFYVPLDPALPAEKLQSILDETQFPCILGEEVNRRRLEEVSFSGTFMPIEAAEGPECGLPQVGDDAPAYMVYTSGSTGKPKGVLKSHGAVCSYIEAFCRTFPFTEQEVIGNQTPFFFDASAKDFYLMLKTGAELHIIPTEKFSLPTELMEYMNAHKISFASWVPTAISIVAQLNPFSLVQPEYLRRLFFVGEVMPMKHLNKWRKALPQIQYVNLYGQSELAGICCYYEVVGEFDNTAVLPMGKPLENCKIYLMDQDTVITEPNRIGELFLVSPALALGYYQDAAKTESSFLIRDFGDGPVRCFRTGDLAQYDEAGNLLFAARSDFQIKHMGHRIELGEIEAVAGALPEISRCCCLYNAEKRKITLFCTLDAGSPLTPRDIQSRLKSRLSSYMLPGKVILLDAMPLNANGKIDRQKLKTVL